MIEVHLHLLIRYKCYFPTCYSMEMVQVAPLRTLVSCAGWRQQEHVGNKSLLQQFACPQFYRHL